MSVLFHVQNKPGQNGQQVNCSVNVNIQCEKTRMFSWFARYCYIENRINDLKHLMQFSHTTALEIYHALYNKWAPKSNHFCYLGMVMRSQLAVFDFNSGSGLEQARAKSGEKKYNFGFWKITKTRSSKPIKAKKDNSYLKEMVQETIECAASKTTLAITVTPSLPENIANVQKPNKE